MLSPVWLFSTPWTVACRLLCPWNSPGKNTRVGGHSLLQSIFLTQGSNLWFLHYRQILYHLSHQGSPQMTIHCLKIDITSHYWFIFPYAVVIQTFSFTQQSLSSYLSLWSTSPKISCLTLVFETQIQMPDTYHQLNSLGRRVSSSNHQEMWNHILFPWEGSMGGVFQ